MDIKWIAKCILIGVLIAAALWIAQDAGYIREGLHIVHYDASTFPTPVWP